MNAPAISQVAAIGRHVVTFFAGAAACFVAWRAGGGGESVSASIGHVADGLTNIGTALSTLAGVASAAYAAYTSSHSQQIRAVNAIDGVKVVSENAPGAVVTAVPKAAP
jgi:hypothetical protein